MKNKILKTSLLTIGCIILLMATESILVKVMKNCKEETIGKINAVMAHEFDFELTIWGASTAYVNFNPQIIIDSLGISSINMGIDGTNIDQYSGLLNEYLDYTNESKYLVIALDIHQSLAKRESFYHMHNWVHHTDNENIYNCFSEIDKQTMLKIKYIPFYSLTQFDKHSFPYFRRALFNKSPSYQISNHGFKPNETNFIQKTEFQPDIETQIDNRCFNKIKSALNKANKKGIKCLIVITPCFVKALAQITNRNLFISKLETLTSQKNEILNYSDCYISKEQKYFKDNIHLNTLGANELTKLLVKKLKTIQLNKHEN